MFETFQFALPKCAVRAAAAASIFLLLGSCSRSTPSVSAGRPIGERDAAMEPRGAEADAAARATATGSDAALWSSAAGGDPQELARLARALGATGLIEGAGEADRNLREAVAIRAMPYAEGLAGSAWLASMASRPVDDVALESLRALVELAARPRRPVDPEDAEELHEACEKLLAIATDGSAARSRRILAIRALRMFRDAGCTAIGERAVELGAAP